MNRLRFAPALLLIISASLLLSGCEKDNHVFDIVEQYEKEVKAIDDYLTSNAIPHVKDPSGIRVVVTKTGYGLPALSLDDVQVEYVGSLFSNGEVFEQSTTTGPLSQYIRGWQYALQILPVGSKARIYIPSYHAYGQNKVNSIPANSTLVFDITFKSASHTSVFKQRFTSDTTAINAYVDQKQLDVTKDTTGIRYIQVKAGSGVNPTWYDRVKLTYSFTLLNIDGTVVATYSREPTSEFYSRVVDYIPGVQVALQKMKAGGKARVLIPSGLGFGINNATNENGVVIIPANSNLIVDLELFEVL